MCAEFYTVDAEEAELARRRHKQMIELADWDALDLDVLLSDREIWAGSAGRGNGGKERK